MAIVQDTGQDTGDRTCFSPAKSMSTEVVSATTGVDSEPPMLKTLYQL